MKNIRYRLVAPGEFQADPIELNAAENVVLVRPTHLSICAADQRYYQGKRDPKILAQKLPMALVHEGIGEVIEDIRGTFRPGQRVVMVPNTPVEEDRIIAENYLRSSKFRASGFDGFMQDLIDLKHDRVIPLPEGVDPCVAAYTELVSVSYHTINRFLKKSHDRRDRIGVWGGGNIGFITALLLKTRLPDSKIYVFDIDRDKLNQCDFVDQTYDSRDIPEDFRVDHAFECVGGSASGVAVNQIIDYINPEGTIALMGVNEEPVPINTRMVLEKGLTLYGSSRSGNQDFADVVQMYQEHPFVVDCLGRIITDVVNVNTIEDMNQAFDADAKKSGGKTVMVWKK